MDYNDIIEIAEAGTYISGSYLYSMMILQEKETPKTKVGLDVDFKAQQAAQFYCGDWNEKEEKWGRYIGHSSVKIMRKGKKKFDKWIRERLIEKYGHIPKVWELHKGEI